MLRDYQEQADVESEKAIDHGAQAVCVQMPTGAGKSVLMRAKTKRYSVYSCTMAHRQELVSQLSEHLAVEGISHNIIAPKPVIASIVDEHIEKFGRSFYSNTSIHAVASAQTLVARANECENWAKQCGRLHVDEGHHYLRENAFGRAIELFPNARKLFFTATPKRTDNKGLSVHYDGFCDALVTGPQPRELINRGHLSEFELVIPQSDFDRSKLVIGASGDFTKGSVKKEAERSRIVGNVVETWFQHAFGKQTIIFATDVETADKMAAEFRKYGIAAESVSSKSDDDFRRGAIKKFRNRAVQILINVQLFDEGFDVPGVECVVMARPTQSLAMFLQACGRALRFVEGKIALIIDHVSNVKEHGLPDMDRIWTLSGSDRKRKKSNAIALTTCDNCFLDYERSYRACPYCAAERIPAGRGSPEQVDGELLLLNREVLEQMRENAQLEAPANLYHRVAMVAGGHAGTRAMNKQVERIQVQEQLKEAIAIWAGAGRANGKDDNHLMREFYHVFKVDVLTAVSSPVKEMNELIERISSV